MNTKKLFLFLLFFIISSCVNKSSNVPLKDLLIVSSLNKNSETKSSLKSLKPGTVLDLQL